jgi:catechol 2,3-dioxygenase-like lactoylglutathione lyase family enzyme
LPVADLRRTLAFYRETLGFEAAVLWPEGRPSFCILERDGVGLGFFTPDEHRPASATGSGELSLDTEGVLALHERLKGKVAVEWGPEVYFYGRREFAVRDPDGYLLIFSEETDDPPTCAGE